MANSRVNWSDIQQHVVVGILLLFCSVIFVYTTTRASEDDVAAVASKHKEDTEAAFVRNRAVVERQHANEAIVQDIAVLLARIDERVKVIYDKANGD